MCAASAGRTSDAGTPERGGAYRWQVVAMLRLVCFFNDADRQAIDAVFPPLEQEFACDEVRRGLIGSAFMWVYAGGAPFAGFIADRLKRVHLILGGCIFRSFVTVATARCGGAPGPLFVGFATRYGDGGTDVENMSRAIAAGGVVYLVGAALLVAAMLGTRRPTPAAFPAAREGSQP